MRQEQFERNAEERWTHFEELLAALEAGRPAPVEAGEFPGLYRRICQDLAIVRDRHFTRDVQERLNRLALRGHQQLYGVHTRSARVLMDGIASSFPRAVRKEWRLLLVLGALFFGSGVFVAGSIVVDPQLSRAYLSPESITQYESMYDPDAKRDAVAREAQSDVYMFGFYIWNNISIAFRTFASGLFVGIGTLLIIGHNGLMIGATIGHLVAIGSGHQIGSFVVAHGSFELIAILIAGVAGMRLGLGILAPGARSRGQALRDAAQRGAPLVMGSGGMLVAAAGIEAFWSPLALPLAWKYGVGALSWLGVLAWLSLAGRRRDPARIESR